MRGLCSVFQKERFFFLHTTFYLQIFYFIFNNQSLFLELLPTSPVSRSDEVCDHILAR